MKKGAWFMKTEKIVMDHEKWLIQLKTEKMLMKNG
jgi:hypothetical protein